MLVLAKNAVLSKISIIVFFTKWGAKYTPKYLTPRNTNSNFLL